MDNILKNKIKDKLTKFLNRQPSENEVLNAEKDTNIREQIRNDEMEIMKTEIDNLKLEVINLKIK